MLEKAIIFDIQRASLHDGPGIRTTVFLKGCPLNCLWCHNPESLQINPQLFFYYDKCTQCRACFSACPHNVHEFTKEAHHVHYHNCKQCGRCVTECNYDALKIKGQNMTVNEVMAEVIKDTDFYERSGGGITLSGGEPLFQYPFSKALLKQCKSQNLNTCVETSGFISPFKFKQLLPFIDVLLFDYKIADSELHTNYTGVPNTVILENLNAALRYGVSVYLRCPIIPGINDTPEHLQAIADLSEKYPKIKAVELLPYHDMGNKKRISIGQKQTIVDTGTVSFETSKHWLELLHSFGCNNAIIG